MTYPLHEAQGIAEEIIQEISPFCERICIAGSIRRQKPIVKDIELIAIPKIETSEKQTGLFETETIKTNLLYEHLKNGTDAIEWIKPGTSEVIPWSIKPDGKYWRGLIAGRIKLDFFLTTAENFGLQFIVRTGSPGFSHALYLYATTRKGFSKGENGFLMRGGQRVETREEQDVFNLLSLPFIEPEKRSLEVSDPRDFDLLLREFLKLFEK